MLANCSSVQVSRSTDLTRLMCVPIPRWIPEHLLFGLLVNSQQTSLVLNCGLIPNAHEHTQIPACPSRIYVSINFVVLSFQRPVYPRLFLLQSEQLLFVSSLTSCFNVFLFFSAGSTAGPLRDIMSGCVLVFSAVEKVFEVYVGRNRGCED